MYPVFTQIRNGFLLFFLSLELCYRELLWHGKIDLSLLISLAVKNVSGYSLGKPSILQKYEVDFWQERVMWKGRKHSLTPSVYLCHLPTQGPPEKGGSASSPFVSCATVLPKTFLKMQKKKKKKSDLAFDS